MTYTFSSKKFEKFHCIECDYNTSRKSQWKRHIETQKHKMLTNAYMDNRQIYKCDCGKAYKQRQSLFRHKKICKSNKNETINKMDNKMDKLDKKWINVQKCPKMSKNEKIFECECGKLYKYQSGLSKHKSKCLYYNSSIITTPLEEDDDDTDWKEIAKQLMKKMDIIPEVLETCKDLASKPTTINNNTQFNVMNYLNTECADAMNLSDFINEFTFSLKDLDLLQSKGYQEAMERTFVKQLCDMDKTKRPIHCSDKKRKSFYVKDNDVWEKDEDNKKLITSVQKLSNVHNKALSKWRSYNVDWSSNDKKQDFFNKSVQEFTKCDHEKERNKIFAKLSYLSIK